jgi:D-amino peptidase
MSSSAGRLLWPITLALLLFASRAMAQRPLRVYIAVDLEGTSGVGTAAMISPSGKDYGSARRFATDEVNAVAAAILEKGPAEILVNDAHGDMQNLLHAELNPAITYLQGNAKPFGMAQGLDSTYDAAIFLGFHARAGTTGAFLAHTSLGLSIQNVWLDGREVGEGELCAAMAAYMGVPVILASGDSAFVDQFRASSDAELVSTKVAEAATSARTAHPKVVQERLAAATRRGLAGLSAIDESPMRKPVTLRVRYGMPNQSEVLEAIPGMRRVDAQTVEMRFPSMLAAYRMYVLMYRMQP